MPKTLGILHLSLHQEAIGLHLSIQGVNRRSSQRLLTFTKIWGTLVTLKYLVKAFWKLRERITDSKPLIRIPETDQAFLELDLQCPRTLLLIRSSLVISSQDLHQAKRRSTSITRWNENWRNEKACHVTITKPVLKVMMNISSMQCIVRWWKKASFKRTDIIFSHAKLKRSCLEEKPKAKNDGAHPSFEKVINQDFP